MDEKSNNSNQARNRARRARRAAPSRKRGRPPGQRNTERFPPLRLTLNLDDPAEAALAQVLQDALEQEERGAYTQAAIALLKRGLDAPESEVLPEE